MRPGTTSYVLLQILAVSWMVVVLPPGLVLLLVAVTWTGRAAAFVALLAGMAPMLAMSGARKSEVTRRRRRKLAGVAAGLAVVGAVVLVRPGDVEPSAEARVRPLTTQANADKGWRAVGNVVPEVDQLRTAMTLLPSLDPMLTWQQGVELKRWTDSLYREVDADPEFRGLPSVVPDAVVDFFGGASDRGHAFLYVPAHLDRSQPQRAIVFLHGAGGNWKGFFWILAHVADACDMVVVAPTFGFGRWRADETAGVVERALQAAAAFVTIDASHLHLLGVSNGARAASHLGVDETFSWKSMILVTPVIDGEALHELVRLPKSMRPRLLVVYGGMDDRVPPSYVEQHVNRLRARDMSVDVEEFAEANHFLFFSHRTELQERLIRWCEADLAVTSPSASSGQP